MGNDRLEPSTFHILFELRYGRAIVKKLRPHSGPWPLFRLMRILAGGHVLEDMDLYIKGS